MKKIYVLVFLFLTLSKVFAANEKEVSLSAKAFSLKYDLVNGKFSIIPADNKFPSIENATSFFIFNKTDGINTSMKGKRIYTVSKVKTNLGEGENLIVENNIKGLKLVQEFTVFKNENFMILKISVKNTTKKSLRVNYFYPFSAAEKNSLFKLGDAKKVLILENGYDYYFDFFTRIIPASQSVKSNWNAAFYNFENKKSIIMGFLTHNMATTKISTQPLTNNQNNVKNVNSTFAKVFASCFLDFAKEVMPDDTLSSETLFIDPVNNSPFVALERYAKTVATFTGKKMWAGDIPNGWNSWSGGSGSGGYGQAINEELILKNLNFMAEKFKPFGIKYFQIDDGWQQAMGDWEANERFPHGMKWLAEQIRKKGLIPGLWINAFMVDKNSKIFKNNPNWIAPKDNAGKKVVPAEQEILDVSNPEVKKWITDLFNKISNDWGYKFIKLDFSYWSLFGKKYFESNKTKIEIYREGLNTLKKAISPDTFLLNVGPMGISYDLVDAMRLTLDNMPRWENKMDMSAQGIKPTLRTVERRYYLHKNLWINHPDLIFFRDPLKFNESLCWLSIVGLSGGIVKIGEKLIEMKDEWVEAVRKILPTYGESARPVDLFEKEFAEKWVLPIKKNNLQWTVVGVFNWGKNINLQTNENIEEAERTYDLNLEELGLKKDKTYLVFSFWDENFIGEVKNKLSVNIKPRNHKILIFKEMEGVPQFIADNRHITAGALEIKNINYDLKNNILNCTFNSVPFWKQNIYFYIPPQYKIVKIDTQNASWEKEVNGNLLKIRFVSQKDEVNFKLNFKK